MTALSRIRVILLLLAAFLVAANGLSADTASRAAPRLHTIRKVKHIKEFQSKNGTVYKKPVITQFDDSVDRSSASEDDWEHEFGDERGADTDNNTFTRNIEDCSGTVNGFSVTSTEKHKNHYQRLAALFVNCTIITGNLELTHILAEHIEEADQARFPNGTVKGPRKKPFWFLQDVEEITGYLLIFKVATDEIPLPNLKIIRGKTLFDFKTDKYAYFVEQTDVKYLTMPKFRSILHGKAYQGANKDYLCFMKHKIDKSELLAGKVSRWHTRNPVDKDNCGKLFCSPSCQFENCYGPRPDQCQEVYRRGCPGECTSCYTNSKGNKLCCHPECAAGCHGTGPDKCITCKNYNQDGSCVNECNGLDIYDKMESKLIPREKEEVRYFYETSCVKKCPEKTVVDGKYCVTNCKPDHYRDLNDPERACRKCPKLGCPKVCTLEGHLEDKTHLSTLTECSEINGNLEILTHLLEEVTIHDLNILRTVQVISGFLLIQGSTKNSSRYPKTLSFLENLQVIEGRNHYHGNALVVYSMLNLKELGLKSLEKISSGRVAITNNTNLCLHDTIRWTERLKVSKAILRYNADKETCAKRNAVCHETCNQLEGCWGTQDSQCVECRHFKLADSCVNSCHSFDSRFVDGPKSCKNCHPECSTCTGETQFDCLTCKNFRYEHVDEGKFECVAECPANTYQRDGHCIHCHPDCFDEGCNGPGSLLDSGCKKCKFGVWLESGNYQCLGGDSVLAACKSHAGFYPDVSSSAKSAYGECRKCRPECRTCKSWQECTECTHYQLYNSSDIAFDCVLQCGEGNYELTPPNATSVGTCKQCHSLCEAHKGCSGPTEYDCARCEVLGVEHAFDRVECVDACPADKQYIYQGVCHTQDKATEMYYRKLTIVTVVVLISLLIVAVIVYLIFHCTRYRKKYQEEQRMHMPEIPEYDPSGMTRRPNMNRLIVITRDELSTSKKILGSGAFGTVYAGTYRVKDPKGKTISIPVAIKAIKLDSSDAWSTEAEMIEEAKIMASLDHEHLLRLVGICFVDGIKLVTVLRPMGCLKDFLVKHAHFLSAKDLILYCYQISSAMEYLTRHRIVHCDLAARNVLMRKVNHVEVTDFGLAKMLEGNGTTAAGAKVPFKWVPPECLMARGQFSEASDVWAFGVTCWEIITYGAHPYKEYSVQNGEQMCAFLRNGNRLPQPTNCGVQLHGTLISCWSENPASRPKFSDLKETFVKYHRVPTEYIQDRHLTQRMDSYTGSDEQQRQQIQRLLSLTDSAMDNAEEEIYTDQNGFPIIFNPMMHNPDSPHTPGPISAHRHSSSASSRYKPNPVKSQCTTIDTRLTEVDTDDENYLVPTSGAKGGSDCHYTKVTAPLTGNGDPLADHTYQNDKLPSEYLNVDETTTEEDDVAFVFPQPSPKKNKENSPAPEAADPTDKKYMNQVNQTESCV